jgi:hypothetical protein
MVLAARCTADDVDSGSRFYVTIRLRPLGGRKCRLAEGSTVGQYPTVPAACQLVFLSTSQMCCLKFSS